MIRLWILTNTPSPYQLEFFRTIHESGRFELAVRFMRAAHRGESPLDMADAGFPWREMPAWGSSGWRDEARLHPDALRDVRSGAWDFHLLSGHYTSPTFAACVELLRRKPRGWALWLEQPWPDDYRPPWATRASTRSGAVRAIRRQYLRGLLRRAPAVFGIGTAALRAYRTMGADESRLFLLPYFCGLDRFRNCPPEAVKAVRAKHGLTDRTVFLFSGQLIERKGVDLLLKAFEQVAAEHSNAALLLLGDGPLHAGLEATVSGSLRDRVRFAGMVSQPNLPAYFAAADVFAFPSRHDGWGVVLNEACGASLPIITTSGVGAAMDLVEENRNGFVVPRDDVAAFAQKMDYLLRNPDIRRRFGERSAEIGRTFDLDQGVAMLEHNINAVTGAA